MGIRGQYKNKRDANEGAIVDTLKAHGFTVERMDKPADLICGYAGRDYLVEVKMPKGSLTPPQEKFFSEWRGSKTILTTVDDVDAWVAHVKGAE